MSSTEQLLLPQGIRCQLTTDGLLIKEQTLPIALRNGSTPHSNSYFACLSTPFNSSSDPLVDFIPYKNILHCKKIDENMFQVNFVIPLKKSVSLLDLMVTICEVSPDLKLNNPQIQFDTYILERAYYDSQVSPSILMVINPHSGKGHALEIFDKEIKPVLKAANVNYTIEQTKRREHATDIARTMDINKFDIIACCSGDGTPHEIINGFYQRDDQGVAAFNKIAVTQLPGGSGNALTLSTHGSNDAALSTFKMLKAKRTKIDLMAVKQLNSDNSTEKISLSFLSQCYGAIADSDIGTEHLRWMGPIRFDLGVVYKVFSGASYPCDLYINYLTTTKEELLSHFDKHTNETGDLELPDPLEISSENLKLSGPKLVDPVPSSWIQLDSKITSKLSIFYTGNMPYVSSDTQFFPAALPNDGSMDLIITTSSTPIPKTVSTLLSVETGKHVFDENILHHKILGYRLVPKLPEHSNHYISIDGESFPFKTMQVEVLPGVLTSLLNSGNYVETCLKKS